MISYCSGFVPRVPWSEPCKNHGLHRKHGIRKEKDVRWLPPTPESSLQEIKTEVSFVASLTHCGFETADRDDVMKQIISLESFIGIIFCIVAALGAMLAENKRLSILSAQEASHVASSAPGVISSSSAPEISGGLQDLR